MKSKEEELKEIAIKKQKDIAYVLDLLEKHALHTTYE